MDVDKLTRASIFLASISDAKPNDALSRIALASKAMKALEGFIKEEARRATSKNRAEPGHASWAQIAAAMEKSKTAVYSKYGGKDE